MDFKKQLRTSPHHDVLITCPPSWPGQVPPLYRFVVDKDTGVFDSKPLKLDPASNDPDARQGERKARGIANQDSGSGIAFGTLPLKDEPASSFVCCYLINRQLLNYTTVWTRAPWNDHPNDGDETEELASSQLTPEAQHHAHGLVTESDTNPTPRFLVALNTGEVLDIQIESKGTANTRFIELAENPDIWRLLRNGCVAGVARLGGSDELLPLFSLASLHTTPPAERVNVPTVLSGTLDFKWRPGSTLKVRFVPFQKSWGYDVEPDVVFEKIAELASGWVTKTSLKLDFLDLRGLPYDELTDDYDILVSLEPLRADGSTRRTGDQSDPDEEIRFPKSMLGSYAERVERGVPTMYLGWPEGLQDPQGQPIHQSEYFRTSTFEYIVLHEFGHALGLPHLHQHPGLNESIFKGTDAEVAKAVKLSTGIGVTREYVATELKGRWPGPVCSEWPKLKGVAKKFGAPTKAEKATQHATIRKWLEKSVMIGLPGRGALDGLKVAPPTLGELDKDWIAQLYPPTKARAHRARKAAAKPRRKISPQLAARRKKRK